MRLAMTAEDDQAPGVVGQQVSKLYVDRLHELAAQRFHRLIGAADALRPRINDQIASLRHLLRIALPSCLELENLSFAAALRFARWTSHSICASVAVISRTFVTTPAASSVYS